MEEFIKKGKLFVIIFAVFASFYLASTTGCKKKIEPPKPTPTPTHTPVPKIERIVYVYNGNLFWMEPDGKGKRPLFADENSKWYPSASPDGWYVMFWVQTREHYNLWLGDFHTNSSYRVTFDEDSLEGDVQNFRINNAVSWSDDSGHVIYSRNKDIWKMTRDGFNQEALTNSHDCISPSLSKDGNLIYARIESPATHNLYMKKINEASDMKITNFTGKKAGSPRFSPDGRRAVFTLTDAENVDVCIVDVKTREWEKLTEDGKSHSPVFSHDGRKIVFSSFVTQKYQPEIWMMNPDKTQKIKITNDGGVSPTWLHRILAEMSTPTPEIPREQPAAAQAAEAETAEEETRPEPVTEEVYDDLSVRVVKQGDRLLFYPVIHFDTGRASIKSEFYGVLDDMMKIINRYSSPIVIEGHTDNVPIGTAEFASNMELSQERARSVKTYLVNKHGVDPAGITTKGFGEDRPIMPNTTEDNRYKNRRAEVHLKIIPAEDAKAQAETGKIQAGVDEEAGAPADDEAEPAVEPAAKPTPKPTPTPKLNFIQKLLRKLPGKKSSNGTGW